MRKPEWALPKDHPILLMLFEEIQTLREKCERLEISQAMYYRETVLLSDALGPKSVAIHERVWGNESARQGKKFT